MAAAERDCLPWLDQDELSKWRAFVFPRDRHLYLLAHGLLGWALCAASAGLHPREWHFLELGLGACRLALACERRSGPEPLPIRVQLGITDPGRWGRGRQITVRDRQGRWEVCPG